MMNSVLRKNPGSRFILSSSYSFFLFSLFLLLGAGCLPPYDYEITISHYDPDQAWQGDTFFQAHVWYPGYFAIGLDGEVFWNRPEQQVVSGYGIGMDVMDDGAGDVLVMQANSNPGIVDPENNELLWVDPVNQGHHTLEATPWGTIMTVEFDSYVDVDYEPWKNCQILGDTILEIEPYTGEVLWEWRLGGPGHVDPVEEHWEGMCDYNGLADWSHCNTVEVIQNYSYGGKTYPNVVLLLSRNLNTFWMIDYPSGDILWSCGQHGDFGRREAPEEPLFVAPHGIEMLDNGHFLLFDNGDGRAVKVSRALEFIADPVSQVAEEVWSWTDPDGVMFTTWGGDADRLPNGNTLISNVLKGRIIEVNPQGEKVWQMDIRNPAILPGQVSFTIFGAKRFPSRQWGN